MRLENIPAELKARPNWVVWKSQLRDGIVTKPPFNPARPAYGADVMDRTSWGTFDQAVEAWKNSSGDIQGIGYVFAADDDFFGIDIDDERKVAPEHIDARRLLVAEILNKVVTYTEVSPSGSGLHLIGRGSLPVDGRRSTALQIEAYHRGRFFTMTGNVYDGRSEITDQQQFLNELSSTFFSKNENIRYENLDVNRPTNLTDAEVIQRAGLGWSGFASRFNALEHCGPGEWSETFMAIVGAIDKVTGAVDQVERIIMNSPLVMNSPPSRDGESRSKKASRNFYQVLRRVRGGNNYALFHAERGRAIVKQMEKHKADQAEKAAALMRAATTNMTANKIWDIYPMLEPRHRTLTPPPGIVGEYAHATTLATKQPFLKFAIPMTLTALAGVIGRKYKLADRSGLNIHVVLTAETGEGKSQIINAWRGFMNAAIDAIGNNLAGKAHSRLIENGTASLQGIFSDWEDVPSCCWVVDECAAQIKAMTRDKEKQSPVEKQLRDGFNMLFDVSATGRTFYPPRSQALKKAEVEPIRNLSVTTFWTTTNNNLEINDDDILDGFLSRILFVRHTGMSGEIQRYPDPRLPAHLEGHLTMLVGMAKQFDEQHSFNAEQAERSIINVSLELIDDLSWEVEKVGDQIRRAVHSNRLPKAYKALNRLNVIARRIAAILAVADNPNAPVITVEQYKWSLGYAMQNSIALLSEMDAGEIGAQANDEQLAMVQTFKGWISRHSEATEISYGDFARLLRRRKPFMGRDDVARFIRSSVEEAVAVGIFNSRIDGKVVYLSATDNSIWL